MNKSPKTVEAPWLSGAPRERVEVAVRPQSVIHSLARYVDGSMPARLGNSDVRTPITLSLARASLALSIAA